MSSLSTKPYKGARDFYPEDKRLQKYMFSTFRKVVESYGFEEYDAPILEPIEIYTAKSGDELVNEQTYSFEDRGKRQVVIRPEMTPTVSRMVAGRRQELGYPLRWYSIPNLWRYERPQRGRLREHWQLNVDVFGLKEPFGDVEIIRVVDSIFEEFGAQRDMYELRINDRRLTNYLLKDYLGLDEKQAVAASKVIDRMHKIDRNDFIKQVDEVLSSEQKSSGTTEKLLDLLASNDLKAVTEKVGKEITFALQCVLDALNYQGISNAKYDPTIMRGLDYYTGIVFEAVDLHPDNNRSILGGGRYDGLVGLFGVEPLPTVGFGLGDVSFANFLETHHLLPELHSETDVYVIMVGDVVVGLQPVIAELRKNGVNVAVDYSGRKIGDQFKTADKKGVQHVLVVGENELSSGKFKLKNLKSGDEHELDVSGIIQALKK